MELVFIIDVNGKKQKIVFSESDLELFQELTGALEGLQAKFEKKPELDPLEQVEKEIDEAK